MATFRASQVIRRPVPEVFATIVNVERFPDWNPGRNPRARKISPGPIGPGSVFDLEIKGFGLVRQTLEEYERDRRVSIVPHIRQLEALSPVHVDRHRRRGHAHRS